MLLLCDRVSRVFVISLPGKVPEGGEIGFFPGLDLNIFLEMASCDSFLEGEKSHIFYRKYTPNPGEDVPGLKWRLRGQLFFHTGGFSTGRKLAKYVENIRIKILNKILTKFES